MLKLITKAKQTWNMMALVSKVSIVYVAVNIVQKAISFIVNPIYSRLLTMEEYGSVSVWISWEQMLGVIAMFCLSAGVFNNGMLDYPKRRDQYSFSMLVLSNLITLISVCVISCVFFFKPELFGYDFVLQLLMFIVFFTEPAFNFWIARQRYEYKYKNVAKVSLLIAFASPIIAIASIIVFPNNRIYARIIGSQLPLIILYAFFCVLLTKRAKKKVDRSFWKPAILFNLPLIPHYLSGFVLSGSDRLMISYFLGEKDVALYSLAYSLSAIITSVWSGINAAIIPFTYENCKRKNYKAINDLTIKILLVFSVLCFAVVLFAPELIKVLGPRTYYQSIYVVPPVICGVFISSLYYIFANIIYYYKKTSYVMIASIVSALINLILNYLLIPKFGYIVAAYTTLICYLVQVIIDYIALRKVEKEKIYDIRIISIIIIVCSCLMFGALITYDHDYLRYGIIAIILVLCIVFRRQILRIFRDLLKLKSE